MPQAATAGHSAESLPARGRLGCRVLRADPALSSGLRTYGRRHPVRSMHRGAGANQGWSPRGRCRSSARQDGLRISGRPHCGMWIGRRSRRAWSQSPTRPHPTAGHAFYVDKVVITQTMVQTSLDDQLALQHVDASARKDRQLPGPPDRLRPEATCVGLRPVMPSPTAVQPDGRGTMRATDGRRAWSDRWMPSRQTATV